MVRNYGSVEYEGKVYILKSDADFTGRQLPYNNNYMVGRYAIHCEYTD